MDYIKAQALSPEKATEEKMARDMNAELETQTGVKLALRNVKRNMKINFAQTHKYSDDEVKSLLTVATRKQVDNLSKPLKTV